ncbi:TPA: hypothetical protein ACH3X3_006238 [Trebouxia sp. C0006]
MSVSFPGSNKNKAGRLEKSTDEHKRRRQVKTKGGPMQQGRLGGRPHTGPLEDLGNALVSLFPVEMQYNIRGSCSAGMPEEQCMVSFKLFAAISRNYCLSRNSDTFSHY